MTLRDYRFLVRSDLYRIEGRADLSDFLREFLYGEGFSYCFWMRTCNFLREHWWLLLTLYPMARAILHHYKFKLGVSIPLRTKIGPGLYIGHFGGVVVNGSTQIGANCNLSHGVTIGVANRGKHKGFPIIGDNVFIGPGAMIFGAVRVGNNAVVGANAVVTSDLDDDAVVVNCRAKLLSHEGSVGYITNTDYNM